MGRSRRPTTRLKIRSTLLFQSVFCTYGGRPKGLRLGQVLTIHVVLCEESYMRYSSVSHLPMIEEQDAAREVALIYADAKRELQLPFIPNAMKFLAGSPAALAIY